MLKKKKGKKHSVIEATVGKIHQEDIPLYCIRRYSCIVCVQINNFKEYMKIPLEK